MTDFEALTKAIVAVNKSVDAAHRCVETHDESLNQHHLSLATLLLILEEKGIVSAGEFSRKRVQTSAAIDQYTAQVLDDAGLTEPKQ